MKFRFMAALAAGTSLAAFASQAATVNLTPTADGTVANGTGTVVANTTLQTLTVTRANPSANSLGVWEFDLSGISDTDTIISATFSFVLAANAITSYVDPMIPFIVEAYLGNGIVDVDDFSSVGTEVVTASVLGDFSATGGLGANAGDMLSFTFSTLAPIQNALAGNLLTLRMDSTRPFDQIQIAALEATAFGPAMLTLDATPVVVTPPAVVPLPAGLPLLLGALGAIGLVRRR